MHLHLPKPLHGWREFAGEVGIIVLGVLIALGAEQAIDTLHSRHEVSPLHVRPVDDLDEGSSKMMAKDRAKFCSPLI